MIKKAIKGALMRMVNARLIRDRAFPVAGDYVSCDHDGCLELSRMIIQGITGDGGLQRLSATGRASKCLRYLAKDREKPAHFLVIHCEWRLEDVSVFPAWGWPDVVMSMIEIAGGARGVQIQTSGTLVLLDPESRVWRLHWEAGSRTSRVFQNGFFAKGWQLNSQLLVGHDVNEIFKRIV